MRAYWGSRGTALFNLRLGTRLRWLTKFILRPLYPRENPRCLWIRRLCGPQSRSVCFWDDKILLFYQNSNSRIVQPEAYSSYRLRYPVASYGGNQIQASFLATHVFFCLLFCENICLVWWTRLWKWISVFMSLCFVIFVSLTVLSRFKLT
jgi:hypothetical protein